MIPTLALSELNAGFSPVPWLSSVFFRGGLADAQDGQHRPLCSGLNALEWTEVASTISGPVGRLRHHGSLPSARAGTLRLLPPPPTADMIAGALRPLDYLHPTQWQRHLHDLATVAPLLAAVIAPLSVLLDIPALTVSARRGSAKPLGSGLTRHDASKNGT
jgi:hypothetical protein